MVVNVNILLVLVKAGSPYKSNWKVKKIDVFDYVML